MSEKTEKRTKDAWDKFQILSGFLIAIVIALVGWCINSTLQSREIALKNREVNVKLVEVAVGILQTKPDDAHKDTRMWAIEVMKKWASHPEEKLVLAISGEEDLLALPAIAYAPVGAVVYYGQPGKGVVEVVITAEKRNQAIALLTKFSVK